MTSRKNRQVQYDQVVEGEMPGAREFSPDPADRTGGWSANLSLDCGDFNVIGEYLTASQRFDPVSLA